jgi:hypothetical protein
MAVRPIDYEKHFAVLVSVMAKAGDSDGLAVG